MKKFNKHGVRGFVLGLLVAVMILGVVTPALAFSAQQTIKCYMGGIKIYLDGELQIPKDVNGNVVEPILYNGTTYLPVRALTGMLTDKSVAWDSQTESVYLGTPPGPGEVVSLENMERFSGDGWFYIGENAKTTVMGETIYPNNRFGYYRNSDDAGSSTYILKEEYVSIQGTLYVRSEAISDNYGGVRIYSVDRNGVETLLKEFTAHAGEDPVKVSVNLRGQYAVKIVTNYNVQDPNGTYKSNYGSFCNVTMTKESAEN